MRKWLALLLAAVMLTGLFPVSMAEAQPGIYRLVARSENGVTWLGMAALVDVSGTTLLTSADAIPQGTKIYAVGADATIAVTSVSEARDGLVRLLLAKPSALAPLTMTTADPASYTALLKDGTIASGTAANPAADVYLGVDALSLQLQENVLPGSMLFSADGQLAGMVMAASNEGFSRFVCYSASDIYQRLVDMTYAMDQPVTVVPSAPAETPAANDDAVKPQVSINDLGQLVVDLTPMDDGSGEPWQVFYSIVGNSYYHYAKVDSQLTACINVIPGVSYYLWASHETGEASAMKLGAPLMSYEVPQRGNYNEYGFTPISCWVGLSENDKIDPEGLATEAEDQISIQSLFHGKYLYLSVASSYDVDASMPLSVPSVLALYCPDGSILTDESYYSFSEEFLPIDAWNADITTMVGTAYEYLNAGCGSYTVRYFITGQLAGETTFELLEAEEAGDEEKSEDDSAPETAEADPQTDDPGDEAIDAGEAVIAPAMPLQPAEENLPTAALTERGTMLVDISPIAMEGEDWYVFVADIKQVYYSVHAFKGEKTLELTLVPGCTYSLWFDQSRNGEVPELSFEATNITVQMPELGHYTDHDFADAGSYVTIVPQGGEAAPVEKLTLEALSSGALTAHVASTYSVTEEMSVPAVSVLTVPGGTAMTYASMYTFSPEYMPLDSWDMDLTEMLKKAVVMSDHDSAVPGEYCFTYYIAGRKAAEVPFTITSADAAEPASVTDMEPAAPEAEPAATAKPAVANLAFTYSAGVVTVDCRAFQSEGTTWLFFQDVMGSYSSRYEMNPDGTVEILLCPGRTYAFWLSDEGLLNFDSTVSYFTVPVSSDLYAEYSYAETEAYVTMAAVDSELADDAVIPAVDSLTKEAMDAGNHLFLQVTSTYQVSESTDVNLLLALYLPDGNCLLRPAGFNFDPELVAGDHWHADFVEEYDDTMAYTTQYGWVPGDYRISWFMDGQLAGSLQFTIR